MSGALNFHHRRCCGSRSARSKENTYLTKPPVGFSWLLGYTDGAAGDDSVFI